MNNKQMTENCREGLDGCDKGLIKVIKEEETNMSWGTYVKIVITRVGIL